MEKGRDAIDTITGYYYQFDYYILQLLEVKNQYDTVMIEGIEDVDILEENELTAVQCKYYEKTEYNHSVIAKPIRLMLKDYANRLSLKDNIRYKLYGRYKAGHNKYPGALSVDFAKRNLFTYTENKVKHVLHLELSLSDADLEDFLSKVDVDIYANNYKEQQTKVIKKLGTVFRCSDFEAEYFYYNNALRFVKEVATQQNAKDRSVSQKLFLSKINNKKMLFDKWYLQFKGVREYCSEVRKQYFSPSNISPYERFFLIECDGLIDDNKLTSLIVKISHNWSKLSKREVHTFCPYIYLHGISKERLIKLKKKLQQDDVRFWDGYDFFGADFSAKSIIRKANAENDIRLKILNELDLLSSVLNSASGTKEIYQFYLQEPFFEEKIYSLCGIQISATEHVGMMI